MAEETHLDTAIPPIGWQDADRDAENPNQPRRPKKRKPPPPDKPETGRKRTPDDGKGTHIDVTV